MSEDDPNAAPAADTSSAPAADGQTETAQETETASAEQDTEDGGETGEAKADEAEGDGDDEPAGEEPGKPKKPSRSERYQRQIERLRNENAQLRGQLPAGQPSAADIEAHVREVVGPPPKEEDYRGDYLSYERARTAYELDLRVTTRDVKAKAAQQGAVEAERRRDLAEAHQDRVETLRGVTKDFEAVMKSAENLKVAPAVEELILESDRSAHLQYYLAKNPGELDRLNRMSERQAARAIGTIEAKLHLPSPKQATKAAAPVRAPSGGAAPASVTGDIDRYIANRYGKQR
jgi:hypothetical protein